MTKNIAKALWIAKAGQPELRETPFEIRDGDVLVRTLFSGISRGTERLVFEGRVPETEHETMRAPFQEGAFSYPLKYGYAAVGQIEDGPREGEVVFALFPHQTRFACPANMAVTVPVPAPRAVLAANMETALNILWDARISLGDRVAIVGSGVVGALVGYLAAQVPGTEVELIDVDAGKATLAQTLGCHFALPPDARQNVDLVVHASATSQGLATALHLAGSEAAIIEASWYGDKPVDAPLGAAFHQRRLRIVGSQVGRVPPHQASRWDYSRRLRMALQLLADDRLEALISGETPFADLAEDYAAILGNPATLCHRVRYGA